MLASPLRTRPTSVCWPPPACAQAKPSHLTATISTGLRVCSWSARPSLASHGRSCCIQPPLKHYATTTIVGAICRGPERMHLLTTYLGHTHPVYTYWYLSMTPELLALVGKRLELQLGDLA